MVVARRLRVVMGAYACGPIEEPEASAGWAFAVAAAVHHDVWVFTRTRFEGVISEAFRQRPHLARSLHVRFIDLPPRVMARKRHAWDLYWYYVLWQRLLTREVRQLHRDLRFDVAHHVTFANDWLPSGLTRLSEIPFVWGPVGGASTVPLFRVGRWLGLRGFAVELGRKMLTGAARSVFGDAAARHATLVLTQNPAVAKRFRSSRRVLVEPNACLDPRDLWDEGDPGSSPRHPRTAMRDEHPTAVFAGRLIGFKAPRLAVAALAEPIAEQWRLDIYGDGYERKHLERMTRRLAVQDRVRFLGNRPRAEVLDAFRSADAFLFPSVHDQAGWVAAEASSLGCPVVCLPLGGPAVLAERNARVVSIEGDIPLNLATMLSRIRGQRGAPHDRWSTARLPDLLQSWYRIAADSAEERTLPSIPDVEDR